MLAQKDRSKITFIFSRSDLKLDVFLPESRMLSKAECTNSREQCFRIGNKGLFSHVFTWNHILVLQNTCLSNAILLLMAFKVNLYP